jgi:energy-coupling factor transporter ATP-binding protein EcfA2
VGRDLEVSRLRANLAKGVDTLLVGPPGSGKSHLLGLLVGAKVIHLAGLAPARLAVLQLAHELHRHGVGLADTTGTAAVELPNHPVHPSAMDGSVPAPSAPPGSDTGSGADGDRLTDEPAAESFATVSKRFRRLSLPGWVSLILGNVTAYEWTLVIDDVSNLTAATAPLLRQLLTGFVVMAAAHRIRPAHEPLFWRFDRVQLHPLGPEDTRRLIRQTAAGATVEDAHLLETRLLQHSRGNPRAVVEFLARLRREPAITAAVVRDLNPPAVEPPGDLTPLVVVPVLALIALRFVARGLGDLELYVVAGVASAAAMLVRFLAFRGR